MAKRLELELRGGGGEAVDLWRTLVSHGVGWLPPARGDDDARTFTTTVAVEGARPRTIMIAEGRPGFVRIDAQGPALGSRGSARLLDVVRRMLNLDEDLSPFYAIARDDPELAWTTRGAGRMLRTPTVFEAVVKTICTTNCAWAATKRMVGAIVDHLGEPAASRGRDRAFPDAGAMAAAPESFYRDVVRAGYRAPYLASLAAGVADGALRLEELGEPGSTVLTDDEVAARLLALPGIGPYGAAHVMMLLGRHSRLILDSWTRPTYARLTGRKASDATIQRRFRRYGRFAGLAFWLFLTRDWVEEVER